jgi:aspartyl/asparaginyl beta-hydroxylase (cupin superfamily)
MDAGDTTVVQGGKADLGRIHVRLRHGVTSRLWFHRFDGESEKAQLSRFIESFYEAVNKFACSLSLVFPKRFILFPKIVDFPEISHL